jgi:hypothetical protein
MVAGMFGLMGAYAAGSSHSLRTSIYVLTLVAAVFAFVILQLVIFWIKNKTPEQVASSSNVPSDPENGSSPQDEEVNFSKEKKKRRACGST